MAFALIPFNALAPAFFNFFVFIVIDDNFLQFLKALAPMVVTFVPIVTFLSNLQPSKAEVPMTVTLFPIVTCFNFALFLNAFAETEVIL